MATGQRLDEPWGMDLCRWCEQACTPVEQPCPRCGEGNAAPAECAACQRQPPPYDATFSLFRYEDPVDLLITGLKFRHELAMARVLGMLFARAHRRAGRALPQCLVPMPLHRLALPRARLQPVRRDRPPPGATPARRRPAWPCARTCCSVSGPPLRKANCLPPNGAANLHGAFRAGPGPVPAHVAVLDDVMTTGNTAAAAALALKLAGCQRVEIWACARAGRRGPERDLLSSAAL